MRFLTTGDKILIISVIVISVASMLAIPILFTGNYEGKEIVVHLDGEVIHRFPLIESSESKFIDFPFEFGGKQHMGRLELKDGRVRLHRLSEEISPLSIHADMGWISESYQVIISLPVRLFITIEEADPQHDFDFITF